LMPPTLARIAPETAAGVCIYEGPGYRSGADSPGEQTKSVSMGCLTLLLPVPY
jgi:hypothetical protein